MRSMSDSSMVWNPRMEEPSKPSPSSKMSSFSSDTGIEKCCQRPGRSMKRRSTIFAPLSLAIFRTSFGVMRLPPCPVRWGEKTGGQRAPSTPPATQHYARAAIRSRRSARGAATAMWSSGLVARSGARLRRAHRLGEGTAPAAHRVLAVRRPAEHVRRLRVLGEIEAGQLVLLADAEAHDGVQDLEDDRRPHEGQHPR